MALIAILASLILDRVVDPGKHFRGFNFVNDWSRWGLSRTGNNLLVGALVVMATILIPAIAAHWVAELVDDWLAGLVALLWSVLVLFACIGPLPLEKEVDAYLSAAEKGEEDALRECARNLTGESHFNDESDCHLAVVRTGFAHVNTHIASVMFWFIVFGPFGAVMYRAALQLAEREAAESGLEDDLSDRLAFFLGLLTWIPARIVLLAYALAGQFDCTLNNFFGPAAKNSDSTVFDDNNTVLSDAGICALGASDEQTMTIDKVYEARRLVLRALAICLALVAAMTLAGWFA